jgi:hypothetical protein
MESNKKRKRRQPLVLDDDISDGDGDFQTTLNAERSHAGVPTPPWAAT